MKNTNARQINQGNVVDTAPKVQDLAELKASDLWSFMLRQDLLFWLINIYLFLEYVRPQTLYPVIDVLPYAQIVILCNLFLLFVRKQEPFVQNVENRLLLLFFIVIIFSAIFALSPGVAFDEIPDFITWILVYFLIINVVNTENRFLVFMLMFLLYNLKMAQFSFRGWAGIGFEFGKEGTGGGPGWFKNSGEFGIEMCIFLPLATYFVLVLKDHWPIWKKGFFLLMPILALSGMISSSSRGAVIGGAGVLAWMLLKSQRRILSVVVIAITAFSFYAALPGKQLTRFDQAGKDRTSINRVERWDKGLKMAEMYPLLGVGYANWEVADRQLFDGTGAVCHNVFIECISELGYSGLVAFVLLILYTFVNNYRTRKILRLHNREQDFLYGMAHGLDGALIGYLVSGFFVTVLFYPYFWINLAMTVAVNNIAQKSVSS